MATATARVTQPGNEAARPSAKGRTTANFNNTNNAATTEFDAHAQVLAGKYAMTYHHARVVLSLLRGVPHHG